MQYKKNRGNPLRRPRLDATPAKTAAEAFQLLVNRGCEHDQLLTLVELVRLAREGRYASLPTRFDQVFAPSIDLDRLNSLHDRLESLAKELTGLWTPEGRTFIHTDAKQRWMLHLPDQMSRYCQNLRMIRYILQKRRPAFHSSLKCFLVAYVLDATHEQYGWHDAALAMLCGEDLRAWSKWRNKHYRRPSPTIIEETGSQLEFLPVSAKPEV